MSKLLVEMNGIYKQFGGVFALENVHFDLRQGEIHVLVGENGAGKSTLMQILGGAYSLDRGEIKINGQKTSITSPPEARKWGISLAYQKMSLIPTLSVWENVFLGQEERKGRFIARQLMIRRSREVLEELNFDIDVLATVEQLKLAQRQMVEIAKALLQKVSVLILDEPTAALTVREVENLFWNIKKLKEQGVGIVYVSHRMEELHLIGDRVSVLRDGKNAGTLDVAESNVTILIKMMTGKEYTRVYPILDCEPREEEVLKVEGLCTQGMVGALRSISFSVRNGEMLAIGGLVGSGKELLGRCLFGLEKISEGSITLFGKQLQISDITPEKMISQGVMYFPADRHNEGLFLCRPLIENVSLFNFPLFEKFGILNRRKEKAVVKDIIKKLDVRPLDLNKDMEYFSGGNQQKVVLARGLIQQTKVFIFDEVSKGVDVGSKIQIYNFIHGLVREGKAVIYISSDLPEILHLPHRILVMAHSRIIEDLKREEATEDSLLSNYFVTNNN